MDTRPEASGKLGKSPRVQAKPQTMLARTHQYFRASRSFQHSQARTAAHFCLSPCFPAAPQFLPHSTECSPRLRPPQHFSVCRVVPDCLRVCQLLPQVFSASPVHSSSALPDVQENKSATVLGLKLCSCPHSMAMPCQAVLTLIQVSKHYCSILLGLTQTYPQHILAGLLCRRIWERRCLCIWICIFIFANL